jgi:hypothetical protein
MIGLACGHWLGKFVVGGVPLCCVINRAMRRSAWWLVADCLPCTLHVRTPPIAYAGTCGALAPQVLAGLGVGGSSVPATHPVG